MQEQRACVRHHDRSICPLSQTPPKHFNLQELEELFVSYPRDQERIISNLLSSHGLTSNGQDAEGNAESVHSTQ